MDRGYHSDRLGCVHDCYNICLIDAIPENTTVLPQHRNLDLRADLIAVTDVMRTSYTRATIARSRGEGYRKTIRDIAYRLWPIVRRWDIMHENELDAELCQRTVMLVLPATFSLPDRGKEGPGVRFTNFYAGYEFLFTVTAFRIKEESLQLTDCAAQFLSFLSCHIADTLVEMDPKFQMRDTPPSAPVVSSEDWLSGTSAAQSKKGKKKARPDPPPPPDQQLPGPRQIDRAEFERVRIGDRQILVGWQVEEESLRTREILYMPPTDSPYDPAHLPDGYSIASDSDIRRILGRSRKAPPPALFDPVAQLLFEEEREKKNKAKQGKKGEADPKAGKKGKKKGNANTEEEEKTLLTPPSPPPQTQEEAGPSTSQKTKKKKGKIVVEHVAVAAPPVLTAELDKPRKKKNKSKGMKKAGKLQITPIPSERPPSEHFSDFAEEMESDPDDAPLYFEQAAELSPAELATIEAEFQRLELEKKQAGVQVQTEIAGPADPVRTDSAPAVAEASPETWAPAASSPRASSYALLGQRLEGIAASLAQGRRDWEAQAEYREWGPLK